MSPSGSPKRPGTRRSPAVRPSDDELLDAARAVFAERGFTKATMDAIAERADSTKPTLYAHFGDKEALYRATIAREAAAVRRWVLAAGEAGDPAPVEYQVRVSVMAMFHYAAAQPDGFRMLFDATVDTMSLERRELAESVIDRVAAQIRGFLTAHDRKAGPSVELLASMLVGLVGWAAIHVSRDRRIDPLAAGELASGFILAGLRGVDPALLELVDRD